MRRRCVPINTAFSWPVNCVVGDFEEVRIQMLKLGHSHSGGGKALAKRAKLSPQKSKRNQIHCSFLI
jgi:hypothetical protein